MESYRENLGMLSQIMEYSIPNLNVQERWHANCTDPALGQQKHVTAKATRIKRYKCCIKFSVPVSHFFKLLLHQKKKPALVKLYRVWSPTNSEQPLHENRLIHDIRKGRNIYGAVFAISFDHKSRPYNTDFIQHESSAKFYVCPNQVITCTAVSLPHRCHFSCASFPQNQTLILSSSYRCL